MRVINVLSLESCRGMLAIPDFWALWFLPGLSFRWYTSFLCHKLILICYKFAVVFSLVSLISKWIGVVWMCCLKSLYFLGYFVQLQWQWIDEFYCQVIRYLFHRYFQLLALILDRILSNSPYGNCKSQISHWPNWRSLKVEN